MNRLILFIIIASAAVSSVTAQQIFPQLKREKPDMAKIWQETTDRTSPYFYPRLVKEHMANDTTMKVEKYRRLYLGAMLQEDYNPYREYPIPEHIYTLYNNAGKIKRVEADSIIKYAELALADNPLDIIQMTALAHAYRIKGKDNLAKIWTNKVYYIVLAIISTGTGEDRDNAWWVISPQHEYVLMQFLGYSPTDHKYYAPSYEMLTAPDPYGYGNLRFYFNIGSLLDQYYRKYD